jgi:hypothetical protein
VADVDAKVKQLQPAGLKVVTPARDSRGFFRTAMIEDPWAARVERVQDSPALGFHHIRLPVADPEASLKWFVDNFGSERIELKGKLDAVKYTNPQARLVIEKATA